MRYILAIIDDKDTEFYTSLKKLCNLKGYSYYYLRNKKFPIQYKGKLIIKKQLN